MKRLPEEMLPPELAPLFETLRGAGIRPIAVGGCVRDALLGRRSKDIDIELFDVDDPERLTALLSPYGTVNLVGRSFGVYKLKLGRVEIDFSLPRTERKSGSGHRGFNVETFRSLDFETAARRRDFTVNAIGYDPFGRRLLDPYGGAGDLENRRLRCVDPATFVDDPLRPFRAVQFAARFDLTPDGELVALIRDMVRGGALDELPRERIFEEWRKLLLKAEKPSRGFVWMERFHMLSYFPELLALKLVPQEPSVHPEGDVWTHTLMALDVMAQARSGDSGDDLALMLGILCHDLGKPDCTRLLHGSIKAPGHEAAGLTRTETLLERLTGDKRLRETVAAYVRWHGRPKKLYDADAGDAAIFRLATEVTIEKLIEVARADNLGRRDAPGTFAAGEWLRAKAEKLGVLRRPLPPLLRGADLIALGMAPSPRFRTLMEKAYDAQMRGVFADRSAGMVWLERYLSDLGKS